MSKVFSRRAVVALASAPLLAMSMVASAQTYPERPVTIIVPFTAGSSGDMVARMTAVGMQKSLGQSVVVENRPGASGSIGFSYVGRAKPDGYTVLLAMSMFATNPHVYKQSMYDPLKGFAPIALVGWGLPVTLVSNTTLKKVASVPDLISLARANPGKLTYSSPGAGTPHHLAMELFKMTAGVDITHVPYKGVNDMVLAIGRNDVDVTFLSIAQALPLAGAKRLKILGIDSDVPYADAPDVPLFKNANLPRFKFEPWYGFLAPAGTPQDVVRKLNQAIVAALQEPSVKKTLLDAGVVVGAEGPQAFTNLIASDYAHWGKIIKTANISVD